MFRPPVNRAMRILDRSYFHRDVQLSAARVHNIKNLARLRQAFHRSHDILSLRCVAPIKTDPDDSSQKQKCILLNPEIHHNDENSWSENILHLQRNGDISLFPYVLHLDYSHWTAGDILSAILPEELENDVPTGFNPAGHVAHFNLRERFLPYKQIIGEVTIDKNPGIQTVINKTDTLGSENEYRVLDYEVIAGKPDLTVEVREANSVFRFDYSKVFWNSRLGTEHSRLVDKFKPGEAVCDAMAGVGPFAIPAGKKGVFVWANDLNPDCYKGLEDAIRLNKVDSYVRGFNEDGHKFIKSSARDLLQNPHHARIPIKISRTEAKQKQVRQRDQFREVMAPRLFSHFVMNLPATAIDFLHNFIGIYEGHETLFQPLGSANLPYIHCYCFGPKTDDNERDMETAKKIIWDRISSKIGGSVDHTQAETEIFDVRDVAPNKRQYCATFRLPGEVAFRETNTKD